MTQNEGVVVPSGGHANVRIEPTKYEVSILPRDFPEGYLWAVTVEYRGKGLWGVFRDGGSTCLGSDGNWDWEPSPSNREDDWLETHRLPLGRALFLAEEAARTMTVGTRFGPETAYDAIARRMKWDEDGGTQ